MDVSMESAPADKIRLFRAMVRISGVLGQRASHASRVNVHGYNLDKKQNSKTRDFSGRIRFS